MKLWNMALSRSAQGRLLSRLRTVPTMRILSCRSYAEAAEQGVQLLALPELTLCGYTCGDLLLQDTLLRGVEAALASIAERTQSCDTLVVLGAPPARVEQAL